MAKLSIHESRKLKQARQKSQYVDLLRLGALATPSQCMHFSTIFFVCQYLTKNKTVK